MLDGSYTNVHNLIVDVHCGAMHFSLGFLATFGTGVRYAQNKVDDDGQQQDDGQDSWTEAIVKASLALDSYGFGPPMVGKQSIYHGEHGDAGE